VDGSGGWPFESPEERETGRLDAVCSVRCQDTEGCIQDCRGVACVFIVACYPVGYYCADNDSVTEGCQTDCLVGYACTDYDYDCCLRYLDHQR
jgi:hypothetical protein